MKIYGHAIVAVGGRSFPVMTAEAPVLAGGKLSALDGVAGLHLFGGGLVTIDYGKGVLTAGPGALPPPDGKTIFAYQGPLPQVRLEVEGRTLDAHLDTGNVRAPVIVPAEFAAGLSGRAAATGAGVAHTISSAIAMYAVKLNAAPRIGEPTLAVSEAQYPSPAAIANVGSLALQGLIVRVDTVNRRVQVVAPPKADRPS
jgi:hypothetical protein